MNNKHIAVLVHNYFEQAEFEEPISKMKDVGAEVTVISADSFDLQAMKHAEKADKFKADLLLKDASSQDYDALILPGGVINADNLRIDARAQQWAADFLESGRTTAVICHAPWLIVSADLVSGRTLTSYKTIVDDITNAGGIWEDKPVVVDDNLITSRQPSDIDLFNEAIIKHLKDKLPVTVDDYVETVGSNEESTVIQMNNTSSGYISDRDEVDFADSNLVDEEDLRNEEQLHPSSVGREREED